MAIAKNATATTHTQRIILINFPFLAKFIENIPLQQTFISGKPGIIQCSALGNPLPQFKWSRKDGRTIQRGRFIQLTNGSLMVEKMHRKDIGMYICKMKQSRGTESSTEKTIDINVRVLGKMKKNKKNNLNLDVLNDQ